jgi:glutaredoxin
MNGFFRSVQFGWLIKSSAIVALLLVAGQVCAQQNEEPISTTNDVVIELFYRADSDQSLAAKQFLEQLGQRRPGIAVKTYDVLQDKVQLKRLWQLSQQFGYDKAGAPTIYLCNSLKVGFHDAQTSGVQIESLLNIKAYLRPGCNHCKQGKMFLDDLVRRWPAISIQYYDVVADRNAQLDVQRLAEKFKAQVASFPCIEVAGRLVVGFQSAEITGGQIEDFYKDRSLSEPATAAPMTSNSAQPNETSKKEHPTASDSNTGDAPQKDALEGLTQSKSSTGFSGGLPLWKWVPIRGHPVAMQTCCVSLFNRISDVTESSSQELLPSSVSTDPQADEEDFPLPDKFQLPDEANDQPIVVNPDSTENSDTIEVPMFGRLSVRQLGLPLFTVMIGLIDGFNPCAMWVLVFLLSVLVNIKERKKILIVAGTFVIVSGLAYFVFMTAWFSVFQLVGYLRPVQLGLGIMALIVGAINVKDFFAFHQGVTLSIPDSAKPGIYRRVREIVSANHMATALFGAIVLAILVNIVELLCTAGLPALYTQILTMQNLPAWANFSYLVLYIAAYMFDDTVLVCIVVITMSHRRLQEAEGRWLKLMSGLVILTLGILMIFWPDVLV